MSQNQIPQNYNIGRLATTLAASILKLKVLHMDDSPPVQVTATGIDGLPDEGYMTSIAAVRLAGLVEAWLLLTTDTGNGDHLPQTQEEMDHAMADVFEQVTGLAMRGATGPEDVGEHAVAHLEGV